MKHLFTATCALAWLATAAQSDCSNGRYVEMDHFDSTVVTTNVLFGWNLATNGTQTDSLQMDIYEPAGDTLSARPVVLVGFGGSFISGTRADVAPLCQMFARLGYVAIAPDYRVGVFWPNASTTYKAVMRGAHDFRACVRYLRKTVQEDGNPYRIDPDRILSGGVSAGAIAAIQAIYLDQPEEIPAVLLPDTAALGGIEGDSGSPGYSSEVLGGWSFSGAIGDTSWIVPGDKPLVSVHEMGDDVVPCWTEPVEIIGLPSGVTASGSGHIHQRMDHLGLPNCCLLYPGNDHVGYLTSDPETSLDFLIQFCASVVCGAPAGCGTIYATVPDAVAPKPLVLVPNPTDGGTIVEVEQRTEITLLNVNGSVVLHLEVFPGRTRIDLAALPAGVYIVRTGGIAPRMARVVKM